MAGAPRLLARLWRGIARGARRVWRRRPGFTTQSLALLAPGLIFGAVVAGPGMACVSAPTIDGLTPISGSRAAYADGADHAHFAGATAIYGHGIMGRVPEATQLVLWLDTDRNRPAGQCPRFEGHVAEVGAVHVFEDIAPRLVDLDGDGVPEVIAVRSSFTQGAQLAVYGLRGGVFQLRAATPYIGTRYRWLAPAAWEDLDGDGHVELAYVDRPHLAKTLRVWRWRDGALEQVAALRGVTNHAIGEETIQGFTRKCGGTPEMVLQSADRRRVIGVRLENNALSARDLGPASRMEALRQC